MLKYKQIPQSIKDLFLSERKDKVIQDSNTGCHNWQGMKDRHGYGYINEYINHKKSLHHFTHRIAFTLTHPDIDISNKVVRHDCDNPSCCAPTHLIAGTQAENMKDTALRNRRPKGNKAWNCRISDEVVKQLREEFAEGNTNYNRLGLKYGIDRYYVQLIIENRRRYSAEYSPPSGKAFFTLLL